MIKKITWAIVFSISIISCSHSPLKSNAPERSVANTVIPENATLQQIYSLSKEDVDSFVLQHETPECENLLSVYKQGSKDPAKLNPAEFCALQNYSNSRYSVNQGLWTTDATGAGLNGWDWAYVRVLDDALKKIQSASPMTVYRGTSKSNPVFDKVGKVYRLKGYASTTPNREVAEGFIRDRLMIINIVSGKNIKNYSNVGGEDEFLLPRSTFVRLDKVENKVIEIFTEEGPEKRKVEIVYLTETKQP